MYRYRYRSTVLVLQYWYYSTVQYVLHYSTVHVWCRYCTSTGTGTAVRYVVLASTLVRPWVLRWRRGSTRSAHKLLLLSTIVPVPAPDSHSIDQRINSPTNGEGPPATLRRGAPARSKGSLVLLCAHSTALAPPAAVSFQFFGSGGFALVSKPTIQGHGPCRSRLAPARLSLQQAVSFQFPALPLLFFLYCNFACYPQ